MHTGVSSAVAPGASLAELIAGAARHGLSVLELRAGDAHGVSPSLTADASALTLVLRTLHESAVSISSFREHGQDDARALGTLSRLLGAILLVDGPSSLVERLRRAQRLRSAGATVSVVVRGLHAVRDAFEITHAECNVAWDVVPSDEGLGTQAAAMLNVSGDSLQQVCIAGGGPESTLHEGRGIGALMARLALAGFEGSVIIAPSAPRYHLLWEQWLGRRRGWGCGSHASDPSLVTLEFPATIGGTT